MENNDFKSEITIEKLQEIINNVFTSQKESNSFVMIQGCRSKGFVKRTPIELNLCQDIECKSCQTLIKALNQ
jgi:hypothetical protein